MSIAEAHDMWQIPVLQTGSKVQRNIHFLNKCVNSVQVWDLNTQFNCKHHTRSHLVLFLHREWRCIIRDKRQSFWTSGSHAMRGLLCVQAWVDGFEFQDCHLQHTLSWANYFTSLSLSICNTNVNDYNSIYLTLQRLLWRLNDKMCIR